MRESTNEMIALFEKAREEYFEDGMESNFSRALVEKVTEGKTKVVEI